MVSERCWLLRELKEIRKRGQEREGECLGLDWRRLELDLTMCKLHWTRMRCLSGVSGVRWYSRSQSTSTMYSVKTRLRIREIMAANHAGYRTRTGCAHAAEASCSHARPGARTPRTATRASWTTTAPADPIHPAPLLVLDRYSTLHWFLSTPHLQTSCPSAFTRFPDKGMKECVR